MNNHDPKLYFLVDDHPMVREGLINLLKTAGFTLAGQADNCSETLQHPALRDQPLVIVDLALGEESGIELIKHLHRRGLSVLVYSMHESPSLIRAALNAGARGYVTKRETAQSLLRAVETLFQGGSFLSPRANQALQRHNLVDDLSGQQLRVYQLLGLGHSNETIAQQLNLSIRTLESYYVRIMDKLGVHSTKELRAQAVHDALAAHNLSLRRPGSYTSTDSCE